MTQSSDREHRTPLSPVRRHESITGTIHTLTPEPANLTALLSRRLEKPICFIETAMFFVKPSSALPTRRNSYDGILFTVPVWQYSVSKCGHAAERFPLKLFRLNSTFPTLMRTQWALFGFKTPSRNMVMEKLNNWRPIHCTVNLSASDIVSPPLLPYISVVGPHTAHPCSPRNVCCSHWRGYFNTHVPAWGKQPAGLCYNHWNQAPTPGM